MVSDRYSRTVMNVKLAKTAIQQYIEITRN